MALSLYRITASGAKLNIPRRFAPKLGRTLAAPGRFRTPDGSESAESEEALSWVVNKELQHLTKDPFKVAERVRAWLANGRHNEALLMTQTVSRDLQVPVSWNLLIQDLMSKQKLHAAIRLFNEMKKRGQLPQAQTYTIIFNGCASSHHTRLAVSEAVRIYFSMLQNTRLQPNIIHLNAVLKVAARANDIDTLFSLVKTAEGQRTPNALTYTTILNALRVKKTASSDLGEADDEQEASAWVKEKIRTSINRAQGIWVEVMEKWRKAELVLDEELVCAMGRVLLTGDVAAVGDVWALLEQTMGIPRVDSFRTSAKSKPSKGLDDENPSTTPETAHGAESEQLPPDQTSSKPTNAVARTSKAPTVVRPGNNTLSLVLEALVKTRPSLASNYWDLFCGTYGVVPDSENWFQLLRAMRVAKSSTKASTYLSQMPAAFINPKTFRLVMMTCVKDNLNPVAFENANRAIAVHDRVLMSPDPKTLRQYLQAARGNAGVLRAAMAETGADRAVAGKVLGKQIVKALGVMWSSMSEATRCFRDVSLDEMDASDERYDQLRELVATTHRMVAAIDAVRGEAMLGKGAPDELVERRAIMSRFITSFAILRERLEPNRPPIDLARYFPPPPRAPRGPRLVHAARLAKGNARETRREGVVRYYEPHSRRAIKANTWSS